MLAKKLAINEVLGNNMEVVFMPFQVSQEILYFVALCSFFMLMFIVGFLFGRAFERKVAIQAMKECLACLENNLSIDEFVSFKAAGGTIDEFVHLACLDLPIEEFLSFKTAGGTIDKFIKKKGDDKIATDDATQTMKEYLACLENDLPIEEFLSFKTAGGTIDEFVKKGTDDRK